MRSQPLCGASSSPSAPHTQMTWAMQGPRSRPLGIRRKERGHRLARAARRPAKIPRERETRCWDSPTASRCDSTGSSGGKALVLSHGSVSNSSDHSHPAGLGCSREALGSDTFVFGSAEGLRAATAKCQSSQIHWSHLAKAPAQHDQGLQALPAALPQPVHPNRADFPYPAREWQPRGVGIPSTSSAKNCVPVQGTLLADSARPPDFPCSEMQEQLGGKAFFPGCCHPMVFLLPLFSIQGGFGDCLTL